MKLIKAYKFRIKPSSNQLIKLERFAGCCRFVWNKILKMSLDRLNDKKPIIRYQEASFWNTLWKSSKEYGFLKECYSSALQQKLMDLNKAFRDVLLTKSNH